MADITGPQAEALRTFLHQLLIRAPLPQASPDELLQLDALIRQAALEQPLIEHAFRAVYHALNEDHEASMRSHDLACEHAHPDNGYIHAAYAASLDIFGRCDEAVDAALRAVQRGEDQFMFQLIVYAYKARRHDVLESWLPRYAVAYGREHPVEQWLREEEDGFMEDDCDACECRHASCASEILSEWNHPDEEEAWRHLQ